MEIKRNFNFKSTLKKSPRVYEGLNELEDKVNSMQELRDKLLKPKENEKNNERNI